MLPQVRQAHELTLQTAHAVSPAQAATSKHGTKKAAKRQSLQNGPAGLGRIALDAASCLAEMLVMGSGLVEDVLVKEPSE